MKPYLCFAGKHSVHMYDLVSYMTSNFAISKLVFCMHAAPNRPNTNGSAPESAQTAEAVFDSGKKAPLISNMQAYNLPEENWQTSNLSFVVVGASGEIPPRILALLKNRFSSLFQLSFSVWHSRRREDLGGQSEMFLMLISRFSSLLYCLWTPFLICHTSN